MKKFFSLAICIMALLFVGCEQNGPLENDNGSSNGSPTVSCIGVFSVSGTKQVTFSPGNLQYTQSTDTWSFASAQYECLGTDNATGGSVYSDPEYGNSKSGIALADKVDLFGWSTNATNFGVSTSNDWNDYTSSFVDWGTNKISNDAPNTWRTLTYDEWYYLRWERPNYSELCGVAQVNGVNGLIFLPDNWICPTGVTFKSGFHSSYGVDYYAAYQTFTADQWAKLEAAGAIFLPAAGRRYGSGVYDVQNFSGYWSATEYNSDNAVYLYFGPDGAGMGRHYRDQGFSVRLVKDYNSESETPDTPETPEDDATTEDPYNVHEYVDLGLSVKWATCNVGASIPEEYGDYFAWGEVEPKETYDWSTYKWCNGNYDNLIKYCTKSSYGTVDNKTVLDKEDDAASVNWGGAWRMPTNAELTELREQCTWTWTGQNRIYGYKVTSKTNGNSIFLPTAGYYYDSARCEAGKYGYYWSSSLFTDGGQYLAWCKGFYPGVIFLNRERFVGLSVRPVCEQNYIGNTTKNRSYGRFFCKIVFEVQSLEYFSLQGCRGL